MKQTAEKKTITIELQKIQKIITDISNGLDKLNGSIKKDVPYVILIGPTGAGKSTLTNVLAGYEIVSEDKNYLPTFDTKVKSPIKIEHSNKSGTKVPNVISNYIDCPGFGDTNPENELQNAVFIKRVFECKKSKILIVAEYSSIFGGMAQGFVRLLEHIDKLMCGKFLEYSNQFGLCISKVPENFLKNATDAQQISIAVQSQFKELGGMKYITNGKKCESFVESMGDRKSVV